MHFQQKLHEQTQILRLFQGRLGPTFAPGVCYEMATERLGDAATMMSITRVRVCVAGGPCQVI